MKVGFDARMIDHPGIGTYIRNILKAMFARNSEAEFVLYGDPERLTDFGNCEKKEYSASVYGWKEFYRNPFSTDRLDAVHIPHFNVPHAKVDNLVVTIHDFIYTKFPDSRTAIKGIAVRFAIANALRRAKRIIAVSENTKKDIIDFLPETKGKIEVVYEAADPVYNQMHDYSSQLAVRNKYGLPQEIILSVGSLKKHKNLERLVDAYLLLKKRSFSHKLVIVGRYRPRENAILRKIRTSDAFYLGEIPIKDLAELYSMATCFVMPSLYEGFGLPILEAMSSATPVVCSKVSSIPEVAADAAYYFDPYDTGSITEAIAKVVSDYSLRQEMKRKGMENLGRFSWERAAIQTLEIYRKAA